MANLPPNAASFSISVVGDKTGETYRAEFISAKILSHRQRLYQGELERQYLGPTSQQNATKDDRERATFFAAINSALIGPIPQFWAASGMGLDLLDDNVIGEVLAGVIKIQSDASDAVQKKSEAAADRLKGAVEKGVDMQREAEEKGE